MLTRIWENLAGRIGGPLAFRIAIQPMVATFFAIRAGRRDAEQGRSPYGWVILSDPAKRRDLLHEGWKDIAKVFVAALILDSVYQIIELPWLYPGEALIVASSLALLPYLLLRGLANRIARRWQQVEQA